MGRKRIMAKVNGKLVTAAEAARALGVTQATIYRRIAVHGDATSEVEKKTYDMNGEQVTMAEAARRLGITKQAVHQQIQRWGSIRGRGEAREVHLMAPGHNDDVMRSTYEWSKILGMRRDRVVARIERSGRATIPVPQGRPLGRAGEARVLRKFSISPEAEDALLERFTTIEDRDAFVSDAILHFAVTGEPSEEEGYHE